VDDDEDPKLTAEQFQSVLNQAIGEGRLHDELLKVNPDSPATILSSTSVGTLPPTLPPSSRNNSATIPVAATMGVIGAILLCLIYHGGVRPRPEAHAALQ
jgi:hypothetical protein